MRELNSLLNCRIFLMYDAKKDKQDLLLMLINWAREKFDVIILLMLNARKFVPCAARSSMFGTIK